MTNIIFFVCKTFICGCETGEAFAWRYGEQKTQTADGQSGIIVFMMQAIVIATNPEDRDFFSFVLRHTGLAVARSGDVELVIPSLREHPVDLIVLALNDSATLLKEIHEVRSVTQAPLLLVTDPVTEDEHCEFLDADVDLVLQRPLSGRILSRYARMFLRRGGNVPSSVLPTVDAGGVLLDPATRTVAVGDQEPQRLAPLEFRLLYVLMTNRGQVITTDVIVERVWGYSGEGNRELVRGLVRRLRRKIEPNPNEPHFIHNLPGVGYRFLPE